MYLPLVLSQTCNLHLAAIACVYCSVVYHGHALFRQCCIVFMESDRW